LLVGIYGAAGDVACVLGTDAVGMEAFAVEFGLPVGIYGTVILIGAENGIYKKGRMVLKCEKRK
jgi:hypothetical protein